MSDANPQSAAHERTHPENAGILLAAHEESERYYFRTSHGSIFSTPALSQEQALELALDEFPSYTRADFEPVTADATPRSTESVPTTGDGE